MVSAGDLLALGPWVSKRALSVSEYRRMGEAGILAEADRVELIEGELVEMAPIGSPHANAVMALTHTLVGVAGKLAVVSIQNPVHLGEKSEPQPDAALLRLPRQRYRSAIPRAADVLLIVEVADSSLEYDRRVKRLLYARHGIPEMWIVNLDAGEIEVCREPVGDDYTSVRPVGRNAVLSIAALPEVTLRAEDVLIEEP